MEVNWFLKERTQYIRRFYITSIEGFVEIKRKIDAHEYPFVPPPGFDEHGRNIETDEPAFLTEWLEADQAIQIHGRSCISMLASSLHLYFATWKKMLGLRFRDDDDAGWFAMYLKGFKETAKIDWKSSPANMKLIRQAVLVRNRHQHPDDIISMGVRHREEDLKHPSNMFFVSDAEIEMLRDMKGETAVSASFGKWMIEPTVNVDKEKLFTAIEEVEKLCNWLEKQFFERKYPG